MNKHLRKILTASVALLMFAGVGAGMSSLSTNAHASRIYLDQYASAWEKRDGITHWNVTPKRGFHRNPNGGIPLPNYYTRTFYKNGHSFIVKAVGSTPGEIIGMDGTTHVSNAKVRRALAPRHYRRNRKARGQRRHVTKRTRRTRRIRRAKRIKRYNRKVRRSRRSKVVRKRRRASVKQPILKSRFKRSNNKKALKRSGFFDAHVVGGNFIFDKYAPNDKRAVVPKRANVSNWYKGKFGQANPTAYYYVSKLNGWLKLK